MCCIKFFFVFVVVLVIEVWKMLFGSLGNWRMYVVDVFIIVLDLGCLNGCFDFYYFFVVL